MGREWLTLGERVRLNTEIASKEKNSTVKRINDLQQKMHEEGTIQSTAAPDSSPLSLFLWLQLIHEVSPITSIRLQPQSSTVAVQQLDHLLKREETSREIDSFLFISSFWKWKMPEGKLPAGSTVSQSSLSLFEESLYTIWRFAVRSFFSFLSGTTYSVTVITGKHHVWKTEVDSAVHVRKGCWVVG